jgi:sugar O-acyltransferase (sialic acid O-acetyltransferase NeuD family)
MKLFILGAGGHARETFYHLMDISPDIETVFIDDQTDVTELVLANRKLKVVKSWDDVKSLIIQGYEYFTVGVGYPSSKIKFVRKALDAGLRPAKTWIHPRATVQDAIVGFGGLIAPGVVVTCNIKIGDYVSLNYNCSIGHDTKLGDYVTCNPNSSVAGNIKIADGVLVGSGAVIKESISVAADVTIGAQSCVVKDINEEGVVVAGVPAKKLGG